MSSPWSRSAWSNYRVVPVSIQTFVGLVDAVMERVKQYTSVAVCYYFCTAQIQTTIEVQLIAYVFILYTQRIGYWLKLVHERIVEL